MTVQLELRIRKVSETFEIVEQSLARFGLEPVGSFQPGLDDGAPPGASQVFLVGPGPGMWPKFTKSAQYQDGAPDALDRWSVDALGAVAAETGSEALFPFGGPPHLPFVAWALKCQSIWTSPVGLLVHETQGLFISFRGALVFKKHFETRAKPPTRPCDACTKPCLSACPVGALSDQGYDVASCKAYIFTESADCMGKGCAVRRSCPVGRDLRGDAQSAFHMEAFSN